MSIEAMTAVWKARILNKDGKPDAIRKLILLRFADHANKQGICWPSLPDVAAYSQVSIRQVQREVKTLLDRKDGLLEIIRPAVRPGRGRMPMAAVYKIRVDRIVALPQVEEEADGNDSLSQPFMATTGKTNGNDRRVNGNDPVSPQSSVSTTVKEPSVTTKAFHRRKTKGQLIAEQQASEVLVQVDELVGSLAAGMKLR